VADIAVLQGKSGKSRRSPEEALSYSVKHRIRVEVLAALHEGPASVAGLSKIVCQPISKVTHHVEELLASGSIDIAYTERIGNITQNFYCVVQLPFYSDEEVAAMTPDERRVTAGLILQAAMAEAMAALWAGKLRSDPRVMLAWNRINLDKQGRDDLADEQGQSWERIKEIEAEAACRRAESGEPGVTHVVTSLGYERSRTTAPEPVTSGEGAGEHGTAVLQRKGSRSVEEAVSYSWGHRIRVEVLAALHEGPASINDLSKIVGQTISKVTHHVEELLASGSIEIARTERIGNITQNFYCVVKLPFFSDEEVAAMTSDERQVLAGVILQAAMAEAMAAFWAGKLHTDPRVMLAWNRINLDEQGRDDLADEQERSWERIKEIEAEAACRRAESGEPGVTHVVTSLGYERSRTTAPEPVTSGESPA
jgi:Bacterial regulatory protein, arsR family